MHTLTQKSVLQAFQEGFFIEGFTHPNNFMSKANQSTFLPKIIFCKSLACKVETPNPPA